MQNARALVLVRLGQDAEPHSQTGGQLPRPLYRLFQLRYAFASADLAYFDNRIQRSIQHESRLVCLPRLEPH